MEHSHNAFTHRAVKSLRGDPFGNAGADGSGAAASENSGQPGFGIHPDAAVTATPPCDTAQAVDHITRLLGAPSFIPAQTSAPLEAAPPDDHSATRSDLAGQFPLHKLIRATGDDRALESVMEERRAQLAQGYTPAADDQKTVMEFLNLLRMLGTDVDTSWHIMRARQNPRDLRRFLVKQVATGLAAIERLDREFFPD